MSSSALLVTQSEVKALQQSCWCWKQKAAAMWDRSCVVWALDFVRDLQHRLPRILPPGAQLSLLSLSPFAWHWMGINWTEFFSNS